MLGLNQLAADCQRGHNSYMPLNDGQFGKSHHKLASISALERLALIPSYSDVSGYSPSYESSVNSPELDRHHYVEAQKYHNETVKPWADHTFALMEQERIPHHPKLKKQYDSGMITPQDYASQLLMILPHA